MNLRFKGGVRANLVTGVHDPTSEHRNPVASFSAVLKSLRHQCTVDFNTEQAVLGHWDSKLSGFIYVLRVIVISSRQQERVVHIWIRGVLIESEQEFPIEDSPCGSVTEGMTERNIRG